MPEYSGIRRIRSASLAFSPVFLGFSWRHSTALKVRHTQPPPGFGTSSSSSSMSSSSSCDAYGGTAGPTWPHSVNSNHFTDLKNLFLKPHRKTNLRDAVRCTRNTNSPFCWLPSRGKGSRLRTLSNPLWVSSYSHSCPLKEMYLVLTLRLQMLLERTVFV